MKFKMIGVIGGVGPEATIDLYRWIIKLTPAKKDQDHIPTLIYSYPQIPDRTKALLCGGENPLPYLIKAAKVLENGGADFIIIPCNTAHKFLPQLEKEVGIPIINMIIETRNCIIKEYPDIKSIGLLATEGTIKTRVYHEIFEKKGLKIISPSEKILKENVMEAVYGIKGIKAGFTGPENKKLLKAATEHLHKRGAEVVIMGCTEIPLVLEQDDVTFPLVNPTKILARVAVDFALEKRYTRDNRCQQD